MKKILTLSITLLLLSVAGFALTPITGATGGCIGATTHLYDTTGGGTWSTSNAAIASVNSTGVVTGVAAGTATITYTLGSSYVTASFTVSAPPSAITGVPSMLCVGSTATLADATSGGTWSSSSSYVASVSSSTGVVMGIYAGTTTISYTMGTGCAATASLTVGASSGVLPDSITGAASICAGSSTSYSTTATGGTWSSSNTSVATVSTSGVVTGVSAGTASIIYTVSTACGTLSNSATIVVLTTTSAGTITGTTTVSAGATTTLYDAIPGGTWSSGSTGIASINPATGVVYGITAGTATITYSVSGCSGTATTTTTVTVTTFGGISGHVLLGSAAYYGTVKVWLITYNSSTMILQAVDSASLTCSGASSVYYQFSTPATDSYRVKAAVLDTTGTTTGYIPTYHDTSYYWYNATVINHTAGTGDINKDINMAYGAVTSGPGFIGGNVTTGANKGTASAVPAVGLRMLIINSSTNHLVGKTITDASGNYSFSNLPVGQTYTIFPEALNYRTISYSGINLTSSSSSMSLASFVQHTVSKTITPIYEQVVDVKNNAVTINTFPNPTNGKLNVQWLETNNEHASISVTDITGNVIYKSNIDMNEGSGATQVDLSGFANGLYIINVKTNSINYTNKVQVQH